MLTLASIMRTATDREYRGSLAATTRVADAAPVVEQAGGTFAVVASQQRVVGEVGREDLVQVFMGGGGNTD